jgi:hypothetical protein
MDPVFVQVGKSWINLSVVTSVDLVVDPDDPKRVKEARLNYTSGKFQRFEDQDSIQLLATWLRAHKAK